MFERFTDRARRAVVLAQEICRDRGGTAVGTEHLLLGLIRAEGVAAQALGQHHFDGQTLGLAISGTNTPPITTGHIPYTMAFKKVLELALREAIRLGHHYIGTEHLLLGILREDGGRFLVAVCIPEDVALEDLAATVERIVGEAPEGPPPPSEKEREQKERALRWCRAILRHQTPEVAERVLETLFAEFVPPEVAADA